MMEPIRISAQEARRHAQDGSALLVCAYEDEEKFSNNHLEGAISFQTFTSRKPDLSHDQEIIFYCA